MPIKDEEERRTYQREWKRREAEKIRKKAIEILGGKCIECGETDWIVLEIDHIEPLMRINRIHKLHSGINLARRIVNGTYSKENYQLLCANDHKRKTYKERIKYKNYVK